MARSGGVRPKKNVEAEVQALKVRLGKLRSVDWLEAQLIFDRMTDLCGARGPSNGKMAPRACKYCNYYGHTRQYCPVRARDQELADDKEYQKLVRDRYVPIAGPDSPRCKGPEHWAYIVETRRLFAAK